jgi:hypothetical protein
LQSFQKTFTFLSPEKYYLRRTLRVLAALEVSHALALHALATRFALAPTSTAFFHFFSF